MRSWLGSFAVVLLVAGISEAGCVYFRTSAVAEKCGPADPRMYDHVNPYHDADDIPELQEKTSQVLIHVTCSCEYSLKGSDLLCDTEQHTERSSVIGVDDAKASCRRSSALCKDVCPNQLP